MAKFVKGEWYWIDGIKENFTVCEPRWKVPLKNTEPSAAYRAQ